MIIQEFSSDDEWNPAVFFLTSICEIALGEGLITSFGVQPDAPVSGEEIEVFVALAAGPFVETTSFSIADDQVSVTFVQDGFDFSPNPPHSASVSIGALPAGEYDLKINVEHGADGFSIVQMTFRVGRIESVPSLSTWASMILLLLTLGIGFYKGDPRSVRHSKFLA